MANNKTTKHINPQCQIIVFSWDIEAEGSPSNSELAGSKMFDISNYLTEESYQKTPEAAGQFEITLPNDRDWKDVIKKGDWILVYKSNEGDLAIPGTNLQNTLPLSNGHRGDRFDIGAVKRQKSKLRYIGYVDTVRARGTTGAERGEFDVSYVVSGRDHGVVYEETEIFHNQTMYDRLLLNKIDAQITIGKSKGVGNLIELLHNLFLAPQKLTEDKLENGSLTSIAQQWLMPSNLLSLLGLGGGADTYYGNIPGLLDIQPSPASYPPEKPSNLLTGICWDRLRSHSLEPYHELYTELDNDGNPKLIFRMIPWVVDQRSLSKFPSIVNAVGAENLLFAANPESIIELENIDIIEWDLGEDDHTRYNAFWSTVSSTMIGSELNNALLDSNNPDTGFPRIKQASIKRHGFRMLFSEVNANIITGSERANPKLLKEFNEYSLEMWERSHEYESGTMSIIGNNEVRLGKIIHIEEDSQYNSDKYLYIEGYNESFIVSDTGAAEWSMGLFLTRGIEGSVLKDSSLVTKRQSPFDNNGDYTPRKDK